MDAIEVLKTRRSVRAYERKTVSKAIIEEIIDCGRLAASANNAQPWEFLVATDPDMLRRIAKATDYEDGSAATENILLAARAHGLGSCWVAGDKKSYAGEICDLMGAPANCKLVSMIPIGYPAESPEPPKRRVSDVLHWEKYGGGQACLAPRRAVHEKSAVRPIRQAFGVCQVWLAAPLVL
jgi:nitroreductase